MVLIHLKKNTPPEQNKKSWLIRERHLPNALKTLSKLRPRNLKTRNTLQWRSTLEAYAYPVVGEKPISSITKVDVLAILEPIWLTKNETASRLRGRIEAIIDYAKAKEYLKAITLLHGKVCLSPAANAK
jgi:hypothetical protein